MLTSRLGTPGSTTHVRAAYVLGQLSSAPRAGLLGAPGVHVPLVGAIGVVLAEAHMMIALARLEHLPALAEDLPWATL